jgi:hypothetical protein
MTETLEAPAEPKPAKKQPDPPAVRSRRKRLRRVYGRRVVPVEIDESMVAYLQHKDVRLLPAGKQKDNAAIGKALGRWIRGARVALDLGAGGRHA